MENKMDGKSYVLENIIQNYRIKDEEKVTSETIYQILENFRFFIKNVYNICKQKYKDCICTLDNKCFLADEATIERII